jgi:SlyX protein
MASVNESRISTMTESNHIDRRLTQLEIKASYAEDMLDKLDQIIIGQQTQIELLTREVQRLRQLPPDMAAATARNLRDDLPPHY